MLQTHKNTHTHTSSKKQRLLKGLNTVFSSSCPVCSTKALRIRGNNECRPRMCTQSGGLLRVHASLLTLSSHRSPEARQHQWRVKTHWPQWRNTGSSGIFFFRDHKIQRNKNRHRLASFYFPFVYCRTSWNFLTITLVMWSNALLSLRIVCVLDWIRSSNHQNN